MVTKTLELRSLPTSHPAAVASAFERLFEREYARVVRIAQRVLGDTGEAEDVAQEAFVASGGAATAIGRSAAAPPAGC